MSKMPKPANLLGTFVAMGHWWSAYMVLLILTVRYVDVSRRGARRETAASDAETNTGATEPEDTIIDEEEDEEIEEDELEEDELEEDELEENEPEEDEPEEEEVEVEGFDMGKACVWPLDQIRTFLLVTWSFALLFAIATLFCAFTGRCATADGQGGATTGETPSTWLSPRYVSMLSGILLLLLASLSLAAITGDLPIANLNLFRPIGYTCAVVGLIFFRWRAARRETWTTSTTGDPHQNPFPNEPLHDVFGTKKQNEERSRREH